MESKKKIDFKRIGEGLTEKARSGFETAKESAVKAKDTVANSAESFIQSIDKTGDGKFNLEDITEIKRQLQEKQRQAKLKRDLDALNPIFPDDLSEGEFFLSKMIQLAEMDKKHASNPICEGSIGHETLVKDLRIVTVYKDQTGAWGIQFYPNDEQDFYFVDPLNPQRYIAINCYFDYIRKARISELQRIAQDLGASFFRVTIKEMKKTLYKEKGSAKATGGIGKKKATISGEFSSVSSEMSDGEIAAQSSFQGHSPSRPELFFYRNEPDIKSLIEMRMDRTNTLTEQHLSLRCISSSGISKKMAASIDGAFNSLKCTGNTTFTSEAQNETRQIFEYDILF